MVQKLWHLGEAGHVSFPHVRCLPVLFFLYKACIKLHACVLVNYIPPVDVANR